MLNRCHRSLRVLIKEILVEEKLRTSMEVKQFFPIVKSSVDDVLKSKGIKEFPTRYIGLRNNFAIEGQLKTHIIEISLFRFDELDDRPDVVRALFAMLNGLCAHHGWFVLQSKNSSKIELAPNYTDTLDKPPAELYHVTPKKNVQNILKRGLIPKKGGGTDYGSKYEYPPRIYLGTKPDLIDSLPGSFRKMGVKNLATLKIDSAKLPNDIIFYKDPENADDIWTYSRIPASAISVMDEFEQYDSAAEHEAAEEESYWRDRRETYFSLPAPYGKWTKLAFAEQLSAKKSFALLRWLDSSKSIYKDDEQFDNSLLTHLFSSIEDDHEAAASFITSKNRHFRWNAIEHVAVPELDRYLNDPDEVLRLRIVDRTMLAQAKKLLKDRDAYVREAAKKRVEELTTGKKKTNPFGTVPNKLIDY